MLSEMTDSRCAQCAIIDQLRAYFEAEYDRKAAEMRRMVNQAHEQIGATMADMQQLQARVRELEAALAQSQAVTDSVANGDLGKKGVGDD